MTVLRSTGFAILVLALISGAATALSAEGGGQPPPKKAKPGAPPAPPPPPGAEGAGEGSFSPPKVEWIDTDGVVPQEWGWGGKVVLTWESTEFKTSPSKAVVAKVRIENKGPGTATIPWENGHLSNSFGTCEMAYEGTVKVEGLSRFVGLCSTKTSTTLEAGEIRSEPTCVLGDSRVVMPGTYTVTLSRPKEVEGEKAKARWRVLPPIRIVVNPASADEIEEIVQTLEKRKSWRDVPEIALLGELGDVRLLPYFQEIVRELEEIMARDPDGPVLALRDARWAVAKTKVLVALKAGKDEEVCAFLESKQPDDRKWGYFKAMLRARMEVLKKGR